MKENLMNFMNKTKTFWGKRTKAQKGIFIGTVSFLIILIFGISTFLHKTNYVPLYSNLSLQEVGQIKEELDSRGIPFELDEGGTTITVPENKVSTLLVDLASQGIPTSGNIDYSFFSENASWGITDNEFNMIKLDAMNTELANLIKRIEGIDEAQVMITLPKESVFVSESTEEASASIIIHTQRGYQFQGNQIESLYHLVSKAVPNLPRDNIVIRNQFLEYFDDDSQYASGEHQAYTYQQTVKKDIERDIQRRLEQMLGAMVGMDSVIVSVTADIDFTKENRIEDLIDPVDLDNMDGLPVSIETIHETYSGNPEAGGIQGTGQEEPPGYNTQDGSDNGEYELIKETINNEFNRIRKEIVESPFKVRDLGIQVAVNNVIENDSTNIQYLSQQEQLSVETGISEILNSIISTSIDKEYGEINPDEKISIVFQEFSGIETITPQTTFPVIPLWMYIVGSILLLITIILGILLWRKNNMKEEEVVESYETEQTIEIPDITNGSETEANIRRKQLEKMAEENPEDFAKLLRSWISDD